MTSTGELLAAYHEQVRMHVPRRLPSGVVVRHAEPVLRWYGKGERGYVLYQDVSGWDVPALAARERDWFAARQVSFEWKYHAYDRPADLPRILVGAGYHPDETEAIVAGRAADLAVEPDLPPGLRLREVSGEPAELNRIMAMQAQVWGGDFAWLADSLGREWAADRSSLTFLVAEAGDSRAGWTVVCSAWTRYLAGTEFATLWGGATLPAWRRRGIYRATVAWRASRAVELGYRYLQLDASDDSRPILERLGLRTVTTTTPYVWRPPGPPVPPRS